MGVVTGPIAIVKVGNTAIGYMKDIRANESYQRTDIKGIGRLTAVESPVTGFSGTLSCSWFNLDFRKSGLPGSLPRTAASLQEYIDSVLLTETGLTVNIYKKIKDPGVDISPAGIVTPIIQIYAQITRVFLDTEGFDIVDGQVSGKTQGFRFLDPIIYNP